MYELRICLHICRYPCSHTLYPYTCQSYTLNLRSPTLLKVWGIAFVLQLGCNLLGVPGLVYKYVISELLSTVTCVSAFWSYYLLNIYTFSLFTGLHSHLIFSLLPVLMSTAQTPTLFAKLKIILIHAVG